MVGRCYSFLDCTLVNILIVLLGFRLQSTKCMTLVEMWKKLQHTNVVQLREVFTTKAFGDNCKWGKVLGTISYKCVFNAAPGH